MKKLRRLIFIFVLATVLPVFGQVSEYAVKAAYLYNFVKFVEWPPGAFRNEYVPFLIGILGDDPFGDLLDSAVKDKGIFSRAIHVKRFDGFDGTQIAQLRHCQILFIAYSEKGRLREILQALRGSQVLTVSEIEKFPLLGGMIFFDQEGQRVTLAINLKAAQRAQLTISSKLLQVSKIYKAE